MRGRGGRGRLWGDRRGSIALELALVLPMLLLLTAGVIEAGLMLMTDATLELAVRAATRYGITGAGGNTRDDTIRGKIGEMMNRWKGETGTLKIEFNAYPSLDNIGKPEPFNDANDNKVYDPGETFTDVNKNGQWDSDMAAATAGGTGDIVIYRIQLERPGFTGVLALAGVSTLTFSRQVAVENE